MRFICHHPSDPHTSAHAHRQSQTDKQKHYGIIIPSSTEGATTPPSRISGATGPAAPHAQTSASQPPAGSSPALFRPLASQRPAIPRRPYRDLPLPLLPTRQHNLRLRLPTFTNFLCFSSFLRFSLSCLALVCMYVHMNNHTQCCSVHTRACVPWNV